jgi:hypothetical protein
MMTKKLFKKENYLNFNIKKYWSNIYKNEKKRNEKLYFFTIQNLAIWFVVTQYYRPY